MDELVQCSGPRSDTFQGSIGLRIGGIFILFVSSGVATLFPVVTRRIPRCALPMWVFDGMRYFGSGVIISTAFIHMLAPSVEELSSPCLNATFQRYPFAFVFAMISMFCTFFIDLMLFRVGQAKVQSLAYDCEHDRESQNAGHVSAPNDAVRACKDGKMATNASIQPENIETLKEDARLASAASQILGVALLEFGIIFHSVIIGITLGTTNDFITLFVVIIFHQMFEGPGLGVRLALLPLRPGSYIPYIGAIAYALVTPLGLALGLGLRHFYNEESATASYVTGIFDSISAGILLFSLVELLAHDFVFSNKMHIAPIGKVFLAVGEMLFGAGIMALLARWA